MGLYINYTDLELISLLKENDKKAFTEVYNRFWKKMYAVAYARLANSSICEDIVHDVFADLWTRRNELQIRNLNAYLAQAVKFSIFKNIRDSSRMGTYSDKAFAETPSKEPSIEKRMDARDRLSFLYEEIDRLPTKCKIIFKYSREEYLSNQEIAKKLDVSVRTVDNQLSNAKRRLRNALDKSFIFILFCEFFF